MTTKRIIVKPMLMGIITIIICFGFTACISNDDDPSGHHDAPTIYESYGLTYHNFDHTDDVLILNNDTTEIAIKKSLADKLGITSFLNHPIGIWDAPSHLAYGRKAVEERIEGDTYILKVTKVTIAELIGDKVALLNTDVYVNTKANATDHGAKYRDENGKIHPAAVLLTSPYGYDKKYHLPGDQHSPSQAEAIRTGEYDFKTAEDIFAKRPNGSWNVSIISMHETIEFDHDIPLSEDPDDAINIRGEVPLDIELNYFLTIDPDIHQDHWWSIPELIVKKFETGLEGDFGFHPNASIGFKKEIKLPEDKGQILLATFNGYSFCFMVGLVPVTVVVEPSFYLQIDASISGAAQVGFEYDYANSFNAGISYEYDKGWSSISEYDVKENEFKFNLPQLDFKADAGIALFIVATAKIYDVAGPELGIGPRLGAEAEVIISPDGIDCREEVNMKLQGWGGAKVEILGYKLAEWNTRFDIAGPWEILKFPSDK